MVDIQGKPLLKWIVDRMRAVKGVDDVVLCTSDNADDAELIERANEWGIPSIAGSADNIVSRLQEAAETFHADVVLRATGDNPLVSVEYTERLVSTHKYPEIDYSRVNSMPLGSTVEGLSRGILHRINNSLPSPSHSEYLLLYAFRPDRYNCVVLHPPEAMRRPRYAVTVDTPTDLARARRIFAEVKGDQEIGPSIHDVIQFLDQEKDYKGIAEDTTVKMPTGSCMPYHAFLDMMGRRALKSKPVYIS